MESIEWWPPEGTKLPRRGILVAEVEEEDDDEDEDGNVKTGAAFSPVELAASAGAASSFSRSTDGWPERDAALHRLSLLSTMLTNGLTFGLGFENGLLALGDRGDGGIITAGGALDANDDVPVTAAKALLSDVANDGGAIDNPNDDDDDDGGTAAAPAVALADENVVNADPLDAPAAANGLILAYAPKPPPNVDVDGAGAASVVSPLLLLGNAAAGACFTKADGRAAAAANGFVLA